MKHFTLILLMGYIPVSLIGQNLKVLDEKYGFRGAKFEMPFDSLNLVEVEKGFYKFTYEDLSIGDYVLNDVIYHFYKNQLATIIIHTKRLSNSVGFLKILQNAYGNGWMSNRNIENYSWLGKKVSMSYKQNSVTGDATIFIQSNSLSKQEEADGNKAASEAAKKL